VTAGGSEGLAAAFWSSDGCFEAAGLGAWFVSNVRGILMFGGEPVDFSFLEGGRNFARAKFVPSIKDVTSPFQMNHT
jgi:hypothetical protein